MDKYELSGHLEIQLTMRLSSLLITELGDGLDIPLHDRLITQLDHHLDIPVHDKLFEEVQLTTGF